MDISLLKRVENFIRNNNSSVYKDQFFLIDSSVIIAMIDTAGITHKDRVLEVGTGLGFVTEKLSKIAKEVVSIEIDEKFKPYLDALPQNVEITFGNAYTLLNNQVFRNSIMPLTKSVSSIPYSQAQNMLHNYASDKWYMGDLVWLAPASLAEKVNKEPILGAYFKAEIKQLVSKTCFFPQPNTTSAIIYFKRVPDPKKTGDFEIFFRRWFYNHEHVKVKNSLREGIIQSAHELKKSIITKKQAKSLISSLHIPSDELEKLTNNIKPEYYFEIPKQLKSWYLKI